MKIIIDVETTEPVQKIPTGPPPPEELGRNLNTIEDARTWLMHPSNWRDTRLFIVIWDGLVPYLCRHRAEQLLQDPTDTGLFEVVVRHQRNLKHRAKSGLSIKEDEVALGD